MSEGPSVEKVWTLAAVRDWARQMFPDAFAALPHVDEVVFIKLNNTMMDLSAFRLPTTASKQLFYVGLYDGCSSDPQDRVYAYVYGEQHSQVGYIREHTDVSPIRYRKVEPRDMYSVDVEEPLCNISGKTERGTLTRLRTLVCYYFIAAGIYPHFGDYDSFTREFERACLYIENGSAMLDDSQPELGLSSTSSTNFPPEPESEHDIPASDPALVKLEDLEQIRSDDTTDMASSPVRPFSRARPQMARAHPLRERPSVENMLHNINAAYMQLERGNKRLKLSMTETQEKDRKLITTLQSENAKLKAKIKELEPLKVIAQQNNEKTDRNIASLHNVYKRRFAQAHDEVRENQREINRGLIGFAKTELLKEQIARADAAEKKLAEIKAFIGKQI